MQAWRRHFESVTLCLDGLSSLGGSMVQLWHNMDKEFVQSRDALTRRMLNQDGDGHSVGGTSDSASEIQSEEDSRSMVSDMSAGVSETSSMEILVRMGMRGMNGFPRSRSPLQGDSLCIVPVFDCFAFVTQNKTDRYQELVEICLELLQQYHRLEYTKPHRNVLLANVASLVVKSIVFPPVGGCCHENEHGLLFWPPN